jgi:hypothetical protein
VDPLLLLGVIFFVFSIILGAAVIDGPSGLRQIERYCKDRPKDVIILNSTLPIPIRIDALKRIKACNRAIKTGQENNRSIWYGLYIYDAVDDYEPYKIDLNKYSFTKLSNSTTK